MRKIAFTGHRPNKLWNDYELVSPQMIALETKIASVLDGIDATSSTDSVIITGMALGVDTLVALLAIKRNMPFIAAIPCQQQYAMWPQRSKERWMDITDHKLCTKEYISNGPYSPQKMQLRNEWMVNNCDILIAIWNGTNGGTRNCLKYAINQRKQHIVIDPYTLKASYSR